MIASRQQGRNILAQRKNENAPICKRGAAWDGMAAGKLSIQSFFQPRIHAPETRKSGEPDFPR
jgi:hypothetical protein